MWKDRKVLWKKGTLTRDTIPVCHSVNLKIPCKIEKSNKLVYLKKGILIQKIEKLKKEKEEAASLAKEEQTQVSEKDKYEEKITELDKKLEILQKDKHKMFLLLKQVLQREKKKQQSLEMKKVQQEQQRLSNLPNSEVTTISRRITNPPPSRMYNPIGSLSHSMNMIPNNTQYSTTPSPSMMYRPPIQNSFSYSKPSRISSSSRGRRFESRRGRQWRGW